MRVKTGCYIFPLSNKLGKMSLHRPLNCVRFPFRFFIAFFYVCVCKTNFSFPTDLPYPTRPNFRRKPVGPKIAAFRPPFREQKHVEKNMQSVSPSLDFDYRKSQAFWKAYSSYVTRLFNVPALCRTLTLTPIYSTLKSLSPTFRHVR